jgi:pyruvate dehydrogenase E2 component (dihydrolipoamide acetyltransferase)
MATVIAMPKLGLSMKTGTVGKWLKKEGDTVKKGEAIVEVMTEKITNKVEAPADGTLLKIVSQKGAKLPVGGLMGVIGEQRGRAG